MKQDRMLKLVSSAMLCAIGIVIPMFSPVKIVLPPASFTLGSHVAIMVAMFIAPSVAIAVSLGTTLGFLMGGFPLVIVMRALTHVVFATVGAVYLKKRPNLLTSFAKSQVFSLVIGVIHAACEVLIVMPLYFSGSMAEGYYANGFFTSVILLVGVGSVVHSMLDFSLSQGVWKALNASKVIRPVTES